MKHWIGHPASWLRLAGVLVWAALGCSEDGAGIADSPEACLLQCESEPGGCSERQFEDLDTMREAWSDCEDYLQVEQGSCDDGTVWLSNSRGFTGETWYFDTDGEFKALTTWSDAQDDECRGEYYYPHPVTCNDSSVDEVLCGAPEGDGGAAG